MLPQHAQNLEAEIKKLMAERDELRRNVQELSSENKRLKRSLEQVGQIAVAAVQ